MIKVSNFAYRKNSNKHHFYGAMMSEMGVKGNRY